MSGCARRASPSAAQHAALARLITTSPPPGITHLDVDFDGKVHLVGYLVTPSQAQYPAGTRVTVTLLWRSDQRLDGDWALFTHLIGPGGQQIANLDDSGPLRHMEGFPGPPMPPSRWEPGKFYRDDLSFVIPPDAPPHVGITAGMFKGQTRLPTKGGGADREGRVTVVSLQTGEGNQRGLIKEMLAKKVTSGTVLTIDGRLDEPVWATAKGTGPFVDVGSGRENPAIPSQGSVRVLWDDAFLYAGFEVADKKVHGGWPAGAKDAHLWEKDTIEIMIDPDGDGDNKDYYEIQINPQNLVFDTLYDDYNSPNGNGRGPFGHEDWSARLTSAVQVHGTLDDDSDVDKGYTVEAKIPWASFIKAQRAPPAPGDAWRLNFYAMKNNGGTAWSPILGMGNFHRAARFGRVRWLADDSSHPLSQ